MPESQGNGRKIWQIRPVVDDYPAKMVNDLAP
jgi:hypothetical protein